MTKRPLNLSLSRAILDANLTGEPGSFDKLGALTILGAWQDVKLALDAKVLRDFRRAIVLGGIAMALGGAGLALAIYNLLRPHL